ncbi:hypothetical protein J7K06_04125 [Candidatus Bathyarchaeota archaeon]|nr:hypothetical protein [Candidatus Bathyarchaeota archaeon]
MVVRRNIIEFFKLYLIAISITLVIVALGSLILYTLANFTFMDSLKICFSVAVIFLFGMGFVSLLPLSEFSHIMTRGRGRAEANPAILREGIKDTRKGRKPKNLGMLFFTVGLTLIIVYFLIF